MQKLGSFIKSCCPLGTCSDLFPLGKVEPIKFRKLGHQHSTQSHTFILTGNETQESYVTCTR